MLSKFRSFLLSFSGSIANSSLARRLARLPLARWLFHRLIELAWVFERRKVLEIEGSKMYLDPHAAEPMRTAFRGYWGGPKEPLTTERFKEVVKEGMTVVDVGANIGYFSLLSAKLVGKQGKVYSFEPEPHNFAVLTRNIEMNGYSCVTATQKAVSDSTKRVKLYTSSHDVGAHTLRQTHDKWQFDSSEAGEYVELEAVSLDGFFKDRDQALDVIKLDCEGSELAVLRGMAGLLQKNPRIKMFIEFYPDAIREMGQDPADLARFLIEEQGFAVTAIDELRDGTNQSIPISSVEELMTLAGAHDKIVNLYAERRTTLPA